MRKLLLAISLFAWAPVAHAQWIHESKADAFSEEVMSIALAGASNGNSVGFRCTSATDLILLFMTKEKIDSDATATLNLIAPTVLVRVDNNPVTTLKSEMVESSNGTLIAMVEEGEIAGLARSVAAAKSRVAVAIEMLGDRYHNTEFGVRGSTKAVSALLQGCLIE